MHQPYSSTHHPVRRERIISVAICSLLIVTGFYTTPWLDSIDQEAADIGEHYPMHGAQQSDSKPVPAEDDQHE